MRLNNESLSIIRRLAENSFELVIQTDFGKHGFSSEDYEDWLNSVSDFLHFLLEHKPSDLISSSSQFDYDFKDFGLPLQKSKNSNKHD